jgi:hypothetical protein
MFPVTSRYATVGTSLYIEADGSVKPYLLRRFVPQSQGMVIVAEHLVVRGDRLDNIAARYLGDPEQFWRLCDANDVMQPTELTAVIGRRIKIPFPGGQHA